jgi:hypothetical protein
VWSLGVCVENPVARFIFAEATRTRLAGRKMKKSMMLVLTLIVPFALNAQSQPVEPKQLLDFFRSIFNLGILGFILRPRGLAALHGQEIRRFKQDEDVMPDVLPLGICLRRFFGNPSLVRDFLDRFEHEVSAGFHHGVHNVFDSGEPQEIRRLRRRRPWNYTPFR